MPVSSLLRKVLVLAGDLFEKYLHARARAYEIKKFQDPRRVSIYSQVTLSEEQCRQIDQFYLENYGEKIPYTWHRHFTAFTGNFDVKYFPELLFIPEFERYQCQYRAYATVGSDKNVIALLAKAVDVKTPDCCYSVIKNACRNGDNRLVTKEQMIAEFQNIGEVFVKPTVDSSSGVNCFLVNMKNGIDRISGKTATEILEQMGADFVIQKRIRCHETIAKLYGGCVNTFRIITYRWKEEVIALPAIMRIGTGGGYVDNAHAGGMFIAVDNDGCLHRSAFTEFRDEYIEHPDTHVVFEGYQIPLFSDVLEAAKKMHDALPQVGCVNWDFTINELGEPVLIEANINNGKIGGAIWVLEMAHGCGGFGDKTEEILQWLRLMKKTPKSKWHEHAFGKM